MRKAASTDRPALTEAQRRRNCVPSMVGRIRPTYRKPQRRTGSTHVASIAHAKRPLACASMPMCWTGYVAAAIITNQRSTASCARRWKRRADEPALRGFRARLRRCLIQLSTQQAIGPRR